MAFINYIEAAHTEERIHLSTQPLLCALDRRKEFCKFVYIAHPLIEARVQGLGLVLGKDNQCFYLDFVLLKGSHQGYTLAEKTLSRV